MSEAESTEIHFVLVPLMAPGHMIPMIDLAKLLAGRGFLVTVITTPSNASRFEAAVAGRRITLATFPFPSSDFGLPEGCENFDSLLPEEFIKGFQAARRMHGDVESYLRRLRPSPTCIISDSCQPWTGWLARDLGVPRVSFWCVPCFALLAWRNIHDQHADIYTAGADVSEPFVIPGISPEILVTRSQVPPPFPGDDWTEFRDEYLKAEAVADGVIVNTFHELEPLYIEDYRKAIGKRVWAAGPFLTCNTTSPEISHRGNKPSVDVNHCLSWLDSKPPASVVYVSFGSVTRLTAAQLIELGSGLDSSGLPFLWVVKSQERSPELDEFLAGGFEERVAGRGLVVLGWAPQMLILSHAAVGGFVTHCGWNSTLESLAAGVPTAAWPFFGDQFLNARLLVDVLRVAVDVDVRHPSVFGMIEYLVGREEVKKAIAALMDEGEEGRERRERIQVLKEEARKAMEKEGSSHRDLNRMIEWLLNGREGDNEYSGQPGI